MEELAAKWRGGWQSADAQRRMKDGRGRRRRGALAVLHEAVDTEGRYRRALAESSRRDSVAVRAYWWAHRRLPY